MTPYFLPNNGGDTGPFPRRERTRSWKNADREFVGIGGGTLKFKSWTKGRSFPSSHLSERLTIQGPSGDLSHVLKAEKDVQDIKAKANKENADSKLKSVKDKDGPEIKPKAPKDTEAKPRAPKDKDESKAKPQPKQPRTIAIAPRPSSVSSPRQHKEASGELGTTPVPEFPMMDRRHDQQYATDGPSEASARQDIMMRQHLSDMAMQHQAELRHKRELEARHDEYMRQRSRANAIADHAMSRSSSRQSMDIPRELSGTPPFPDPHVAGEIAQDQNTFIPYDAAVPKGRPGVTPNRGRPSKTSKASPGGLFATTPLPDFQQRASPSELGPAPSNLFTTKPLADRASPSAFEPASATAYAPGAVPAGDSLFGAGNQPRS